MIYVDSNYWIYWLDSRVPEHDSIADTVESAINEGVAMSYVTLSEVAHYLRMLPKEEFVKLMSSIRNLSAVTFFDLDSRIADLSLKMLPEYAPKGLGSRDCIILATMKLSGVKRIATHDRAFRQVPDIEVVDTIAR